MYLSELGTSALAKKGKNPVFRMKNTHNTVCPQIPVCQFNTSTVSLIP